MKPTRLWFFLVFVAAALLLIAPADPPMLLAGDDIKPELEAAFFQRVNDASTLQPLTFDLFTPELDEAFVTAGGDAAVLWLALRDDHGRRLATEPGLVLAQRTSNGWQVLLPGDPGWDDLLAALPEDALPLEQQSAPSDIDLDSSSINAPLTGYYLPYAAGTARWMEGSISHFQYIPELGYPSCSIEYCRYAYDFTDTWHFPLLASKEGSVVASRDSCPNGSPTCTNYIVLRNPNEGTYQIYLHHAYGTIPDKLTPGTWVQRGQYIGDSDDTGYSTSQHVHFMVTNSIWMGNSGYYWGRSIDIRFADVPINNGIPRNCYEVTHFPIYDGATECLGDKSDPRNPANDWYVSGNVGAFPPTGALSRPAAGATVHAGNSSFMDVTANASDDVRVTAVRMVVKINNQWVEVGPKVVQPLPSGAYDWDVNLCEAGPLHGAVEVALRVWDHEGNFASALSPRTINVDHACLPPESQLTGGETFSDTTAVRLNWQAIERGAGIQSFALQWRTEPGTWSDANMLMIPGHLRSTWFSNPSGPYAFRLRAIDTNNQAEAWPAGGQAETSLVVPDTASCDPDDPTEPDDTSAQARTLNLGSALQGSLCPAGNPDWFRVEISKTAPYLIHAGSLGGGAAVRLAVYGSDGTTLLASGEALFAGQALSLRFDPPAPGVYYIKVEPLTEHLFGTGVVYTLVIQEIRAFLPVIMR
jgi:hypothetical protein